MMRTAPLRWESGRDDLAPWSMMAAPMLVWSLLGGTRNPTELVVVAVALALGLVLKRLLPPGVEIVAVVPPVTAILIELATPPFSTVTLLLAPVVGLGLLVWAGTEPAGGGTVRAQFEPAVVPGLAVAVAVVVMLFLPGGTGGQVGLAALALLAVLGLSAWLYLRSAAEISATRPTP